MKIYDSVQKDKIDLVPIEKNHIKIYSCGPTVYDDAHLGHARNSVVFDLLHRVLLALGYKVTFAKNFTDIDDKIIKKMQQTNQSLEDITTHYINSYKNDMNALNILPATIEPKATDNINEMIEFVQKLLDKDTAYIIQGDGVYLDTSKDQKYGSLSHIQDSDDTQSRVETNTNKKDNKDFVLWKFAKENEPKYSASFGDGRPGWHIECSAMIDKHLASDGEYAIDIHCGGADLLFPHHENEASQTRCCKNQELAKYWVHNGFVNIDGQKMSKSLGNSFFLKDALKSYSGEVIRFYLLSSHYRSNFNFNEEDLLASKTRLDKFVRLQKRVYKQSGSAVNKDFKSKILEALSDDLNISKALSYVDEFVSNANNTIDNDQKNKALKKEIISNIEFVSQVLGIGLLDPYEYFQFGLDEDKKIKINNLIAQRTQAKKDKDFASADGIRDEILAMGIAIMDTPDGTVWEVN